MFTSSKYNVYTCSTKCTNSDRATCKCCQKNAVENLRADSSYIYTGRCRPLVVHTRSAIGRCVYKPTTSLVVKAPELKAIQCCILWRSHGKQSANVPNTGRISERWLWWFGMCVSPKMATAWQKCCDGDWTLNIKYPVVIPQDCTIGLYHRKVPLELILW